MVDKKKNKRINGILPLLIFIVGLSILLYPFISRLYYDYRGNGEIADYKTELEKKDDGEITERLKLAYAYNSAIVSNEERPEGDPFSDDAKEAEL